MVTFAYVCFVLIATLLAIPLGVAAHYARAHFTYFPEDLDLGEPWDTLTRDDYAFEKHVVGAKWDDNGFWDVHSNRNLVYYMISFAAMPLMTGVIFFSERAHVVEWSCHGLISIGLAPIVC